MSSEVSNTNPSRHDFVTGGDAAFAKSVTMVALFDPPTPTEMNRKSGLKASVSCS